VISVFAFNRIREGKLPEIGLTSEDEPTLVGSEECEEQANLDLIPIENYKQWLNTEMHERLEALPTANAGRHVQTERGRANVETAAREMVLV